MDDFDPAHNQPEYSVSELSHALKRTVEERYGYVRVRGEISGCKRAPSGHLYLDLKDANAVLNAVCWKGVVAKLEAQPENGLEVIATGKITTYAGKSSYQLVIERMEVAGAGALMALLEKRKATLAAEGLFDASRKLPLPYLPQVIGVVTSPAGAVIRDILHRLHDRFPVHVLVWPVAVQEKGAEAQIAEAIAGFQAFDGVNTPPRPDVIIVARGGGSIEDLWCFNEEAVVRAAAACTIPLISAVGHETDTTLIDYASSRRAPTPTAAAEMAVPVWRELMEAVQQASQRLSRGMFRTLEFDQQRLHGLARGLIHPEAMLEMRTQRLDEWTERLEGAVRVRMEAATQRMASVTSRLSPLALVQMVRLREERLHERYARVPMQWEVRYQHWHQRLEATGRMLEALSHQCTLKRGFAYVTAQGVGVVSSRTQVPADGHMHLHFYDGDVVVRSADASPRSSKPRTSVPPAATPKQQSLF